jgi:hypothetical protein
MTRLILRDAPTLERRVSFLVGYICLLALLVPLRNLSLSTCAPQTPLTSAVTAGGVPLVGSSPPPWRRPQHRLVGLERAPLYSRRGSQYSHHHSSSTWCTHRETIHVDVYPFDGRMCKARHRNCYHALRIGASPNVKPMGDGSAI